MPMDQTKFGTIPMPRTPAAGPTVQETELTRAERGQPCPRICSYHLINTPLQRDACVPITPKSDEQNVLRNQMADGKWEMAKGQNDISETQPVWQEAARLYNLVLDLLEEPRGTTKARVPPTGRALDYIVVLPPAKLAGARIFRILP